MLDTSFDILPIPDHAFFEQAQFQGPFGNHLFEIAGNTPQILHLAGVSFACRITGQPFLPVRPVARTNGAPASPRNSFDQL